MSEVRVTPAGSNIFAELGLPDAETRRAKSDLAFRIQRTIEELGLSQTAAAELVAIPQPKLSNILRGRLSGVSEKYLTDALRKLGHDIQYVVGARHVGVGHLQVLETA
jgi:predicted XRE-type DNA-binding protein